MRKGLLIYEEMSKYLVICDEASSHTWLCNRSRLNFLIYEENLIFFLISVGYAKKVEGIYIGWGPKCFCCFPFVKFGVFFSPCLLSLRWSSWRDSATRFTRKIWIDLGHDDLWKNLKQKISWHCPLAPCSSPSSLCYISRHVLSSIYLSYSFFSNVAAGRACHLQTDGRGGGSGNQFHERGNKRAGLFLHFVPLLIRVPDLSPISSCSCSNLYDDQLSMTYNSL